MRPANYQIAVMSVIVATLAWIPVGGLLGAASWLAFDVSPHAFLTFDDTFSSPVGLMVWWLVLLLPASIYAIIVSD